MEKDNNRLWISRVAPFAVYITFMLLNNLLETVSGSDAIALPSATMFFYLFKIITVILVLVFFLKSYDELSLLSFDAVKLLVALIAGGLVFIFWINMDWSFAAMGKPKIFDPNTLASNRIIPFIVVRTFGASIVVPIFEELFWRSFIIRYIIHPDFSSIKLGTFTWASFIISSVLFGLEHNLWLAGIMAGVLYNLILYYTKNLYYCIIAHSITNFLLSVYVVKTGNWQFW